MKTENTRHDQAAKELVRVIREEFRGEPAHLQRFSAYYLTTKGAAIANEAAEHMSDADLLAIAYRALAAGY